MTDVFTVQNSFCTRTHPDDETVCRVWFCEIGRNSVAKLRYGTRYSVGRGFRVGLCRWVWVDGCEVRPCDPCGFRAGLCPLGFGWMVVRLVRVICVPARARVSRVSRVCPGSPRCLFTGTVLCGWL